MVQLFVINMRRSSDRWERIKNEAAKAGLSNRITRHEGVDGAKTDLDAFLSYVNQTRAHRTKGRQLSEGQIGCFASHFSLWKKIAKTRTGAVVLEDDIEITDELLPFLTDAEKFFDKKVCIRLFINETKRSKAIPLQESPKYSIYRYNKGHMGTQAYYVSPTAAAQFVAFAEEWYLPVDLYMDAFWTHGVECLGTVPALIVRADSPTVRTGTTRRTLTFEERIKKELAAIGPQLKRRIHNGIFLIKFKVKAIRTLEDL